MNPQYTDFHLRSESDETAEEGVRTSRSGGHSLCQQTTSAAFGHAGGFPPPKKQATNCFFERLTGACVNAGTENRLNLIQHLFEQRLRLLRGVGTSPEAKL